MTKSTITREQLEEWVAQFEEDGGCDATDRQLEALIRQSLAAMDSEPVAYTDERNLGYIDRGRETAYLWGKQNSEASDVALYRHAQQPVVSEIDRQAIADKVYGKCCRIPGATFYNAAEFAIDEVEACRAAMLAVAPQSPGSEPATVPGKWIPVSEQMPDREVDVQVYCPDKKEQMVAYLERNELEGYFRFATWRTGDGIYCHPTHWMPLPAAPQEVKGE
ncbi:TPA: DUF551 domain-containing protein [Klebsiella quasipneumoniae]|nr:DUF551 domain-containing protein [Klebsiella quasipneumoniae]